MSKTSWILIAFVCFLFSCGAPDPAPGDAMAVKYSQVSGAAIGDPETVCNGIDDDNDGAIDDGCDEDADGYCSAAKTVIGNPAVCKFGGGDCDENNPLIHPNAGELCDGVDNDCTGDIDDDPDYFVYGITFPLLGWCYTGPEGTADIGECFKGMRVCNAGEWQPCVKEAVPLPEICDGKDNDCDGKTDNGFLIGEPCDSADSDQCKNGKYTCKVDKTGAECVNEIVKDIAEICDGKDNDCDGQIDESFPAGDVCDGGDSDLCGNGTFTCLANGQDVECVNEAVQNIAEKCNGLDDDCDSEIDEGFAEKGQPCDGADSDSCKNGTYTCKADGTSVECANENPTNIVELCNGKDDDCDGQIDEGFATLGQACDSADSDQCKNGTFTCKVDGTGVECVNENPVNVVEICDGKDNDCDGQIDEELTHLCVDYLTCKTYLTCDPCPDYPFELCDNKDNNCNNLIDEGFEEKGQKCDGADSDQCKNGIFTCNAIGTGVECANENPTNIVELCNGKDDDCDGSVDEDFANKGKLCDGPDSDLCKNGTYSCNAAGTSVECKEATSNTEICDSKDNDCDGAIDEGFNVGQPCDGDDADLCKNGKTVCLADQTVICQESVHYTEVCDGEDNDCDGQIDEGGCPPPVIIISYPLPGVLMGYEGEWEMTVSGLYLSQPIMSWPEEYILDQSGNLSYSTTLEPGECILFWWANEVVPKDTVWDPRGVWESGKFKGNCVIDNPFKVTVGGVEKPASLVYNWQGGCNLVYCAPKIVGTCQTNNNFQVEICSNGKDDDCDGKTDETTGNYGCAIDADANGQPDVYCDMLSWPAGGFYGADEVPNGIDDNCNGLVDGADPLCLTCL